MALIWQCWGSGVKDPLPASFGAAVLQSTPNSRRPATGPALRWGSTVLPSRAQDTVAARTLDRALEVVPELPLTSHVMWATPHLLYRILFGSKTGKSDHPISDFPPAENFVYLFRGHPSFVDLKSGTCYFSAAVKLKVLILSKSVHSPGILGKYM